jgi:hypothetical protein
VDLSAFAFSNLSKMWPFVTVLMTIETYRNSSLSLIYWINSADCFFIDTFDLLRLLLTPKASDWEFISSSSSKLSILNFLSALECLSNWIMSLLRRAYIHLRESKLSLIKWPVIN